MVVDKDYCIIYLSFFVHSSLCGKQCDVFEQFQKLIKYGLAEIYI